MNHKFLLIVTILFTLNINAQNKKKVFSKEAEIIGNKIEYFVEKQKDSLKKEIQKLDSLYAKKLLSKVQWEAKKLEYAEFHAKRIEEFVEKKEKDLLKLSRGFLNDSVVVHHDTRFSRFVEMVPPIRFSVAFGLNNLIESGDFSTLGDSEIKNFRSYFVEWGFNYKIPLIKSKKLISRVGFSVTYNNLYPTSGKYFKKEGEITKIVADNEISKNRFKNVYLTLPLHFEYDFSKNMRQKGKFLFGDQESFRVGVGGFIGTHLKTKNFFRRNSDRVLQKYDFNTSDFVYGLSAYLGYKGSALYFKYDLNALFEKNVPKQNLVSFGIRFDL